MSNDWYYAEGNETKGPVNMAELKEKLAGKKLPADALVWTEGMDDWVPASSRAEFQFTAPPRMAHPEKAPAQPVAKSAAPAPVAETDDEEEGDADDFDQLLKPVEPLNVDPEDARKYKIVSMIGYLWVLFIIPLIFARKSPFARFHGNQSLTLFIVGTFWWMIVVMLQFFAALGFSGDWMSYLVGSMFVVPFIFSALGMINAGQGNAIPLPVIGKLTIIKV